jgi:hypothetical protein
MSLFKNMEISTKLLAAREAMRNLYGDGWEEAAKPYKDVLFGIMAKSGNHSVLSVAVQIGKDMSEKGHSPVMLLAVAADMAMDVFHEGSSPNAKPTGPGDQAVVGLEGLP